MHTAWEYILSVKASSNSSQYARWSHQECFPTNYVFLLFPTKSSNYSYFLSSVSVKCTDQYPSFGVQRIGGYGGYSGSDVHTLVGFDTLCSTNSYSYESNIAMRPFIIIPHSSYTLTTDETGKYDYLISPKT